MSSRAMKAPEKSKLRDRYATTGVEIPVARDGLSVYVHSSNPLTEISMDQLRDVFLGKITNWKDLGGPDNRIIVYSRENSSGTYVFFKDNVLAGRDFTPRAQTMPGTASVVNAVTKEKFGIGYGGAAFAKGLKILKLKKDANAPGHRPRPADRDLRDLPAGAAAVLLRAQQAERRHQELRRLGALRRGPGGGGQGRLLPDQVVARVDNASVKEL